MKVLVFGTFDGVHEGHRAFLKEAKSHGDYLIAVVAQNHIVEHLKGSRPKLDLAERFQHLQQEDGVDEVVVGDGELGSWKVLEAHRPDIIALGYDQTALKEELERYFKRAPRRAEIRVMKSYERNKIPDSL